jgi:1,4-alpha-glucan branching enzyme
MDDANKTIIFERNHLIFLFNFHPSNSVPDYQLHAPLDGDYKVILSSDSKQYGGFDRIDTDMLYPVQEINGFPKLRIYLPNRTAIVLEKQ